MKILRTLKHRLRSRWGLMRILRFALGSFILLEAWLKSDLILAFMGAVLFLQAMYNMGCCGVQTCDTNHPRNKQESPEDKTQDITFNEVN